METQRHLAGAVLRADGLRRGGERTVSVAAPSSRARSRGSGARGEQRTSEMTAIESAGFQVTVKQHTTDFAIKVTHPDRLREILGDALDKLGTNILAESYPQAYGAPSGGVSC